MASTVLDSLKILISTNADEFKAQLGGISRSLNGLKKNLTSLAKGVGLTFGAFEAGRILKEVISDSIRLAAETEGVENAFLRLNQPGLLSQLQTATRGALNNLELMRSAVQFDNFNLPLNKLATLMQFVQLRSEQTGLSVELLRESLVEGLAKGSLRRLDNLGFSILELRKGIEKFGDVTSAVANLAQREIEKMGAETETSKTSIDRFTASFENLQISVGKLANSGFVGTFLQNLTSDVNRLNNSLGNQAAQSRNPFQIKEQLDELKEYLDFLVGVGARQEKVNEVTEEYQRLLKQFPDILESISESFNVPEAPVIVPVEKTEQEIGAIAKLQQELKGLKDEQPTVTKEALPAINQRIKAIQEEIKALKSLGIQSNLVAKELQSQFESAKKILDELSQTIDSRGSFSILGDVSGGNFSVLQQGIQDELGDVVRENNEKLAGSLNETISKIRLQNTELKNAELASFNFTNVLIGGLGLIIGQLTRGQSEFSKFGKIISRVVTGIFGVLLGGGGGLLSGLLGGIPRLHSGGTVTGPTLAVLGDNPSGVEYAIPKEVLDRLRGGSNQGGTQEFRIKGQDLVTVLDRQAKLDNRTR